jgi:dsDNA-specific endonuclease/ATPase MutS2
MGRNSYLGGSTVIGPGSNWFSKPKKKVVRKKRQLTEAERRELWIREEAARHAKLAKKQKHEANLRLQQKKKAAAKKAHQILHEARTEAARLSKKSRIEKTLTAAPIASNAQDTQKTKPSRKGRNPPRPNPVVVIMKGGRIVRSGAKPQAIARAAEP